MKHYVKPKDGSNIMTYNTTYTILIYHNMHPSKHTHIGLPVTLENIGN